MRSIDVRDVLGGSLVAAVGATFALTAMSYPMGKTVAPGPGIFPLAVSLITLMVGLAMIIKGIRRPGVGTMVLRLRGVAAVLGSVAAFAGLIRPLGLAPTLVVVVAISALGSSQSRLWPTLAVAAATAIGCWLIFIVGLGLPIPAVRMPW